MIAAFVQARMSSARFPGKVLADLAGKPVVVHVLERASEAVGRDRVVLLTSEDPSDDALAAMVEELGFAVVRGPLEDVVERFRVALAAHPCDWFFRISGDSPLLDVELLRSFVPRASGDADVITNVHPRSYPKGRSAELVRASAFERLAALPLSAAEREHVTQGFYARDAQFRIENVVAPEGDHGPDVAVDTPEDLARVEALLGA